MEKIRFDFKSFSLTGNNYVVDRNDGTDASGFYYRASEVDAAFDRLKAENKMLHETAQKANRLYSEAVSRAIEAEPLLHAVRALVEAGIKLHDRMCDCESTDDGWLYPAIYVDDFTVLKQAIAAVERLMPKEVDGGKDNI